MKFIDETTIHVEAGNGGPGKKSFHREKYVPLGGPDGGNGGRGGSVIVVGDRNKTTLLDFHFQPRWKAVDGDEGQDSNKDGRAGADLIIKLPIGTQIFKITPKAQGTTTQRQAEESLPDEDYVVGDLVVDLREDGQEFVLAKGGRGGKGNNFFKSPTNRAPEHFQPGEPGEIGDFLFSLKLVADVGLLGFPNAGKSTLISRISAARPKIADYPFTTLTPNLGVVRTKGAAFVVADIPGLIPGAHEGKGLGIKFLKHIERTKVLVHLIDPLRLDDEGNQCDPIKSYHAINHELQMFSPEVAARPQLVVITKIDAISDREEIARLMKSFKDLGRDCLAISSVTGEGLENLLEHTSKLIANYP